MDFPGAQPRAVAAAGIRADQQAPGLRVGLSSEQLPPSANAFHGKFRRLVSDAHVDHGFVPRHIVGPVWNGLADALGGKIVDLDRLRVARRLPPPAAIVEGSDQFLLFRVDTDDGVVAAYEAPDLIVEVP